MIIIIFLFYTQYEKKLKKWVHFDSSKLYDVIIIFWTDEIEEYCVYILLSM